MPKPAWYRTTRTAAITRSPSIPGRCVSVWCYADHVVLCWTSIRLKMNAVIATEQTVSPNNRKSIRGRTRNWVSLAVRNKSLSGWITAVQRFSEFTSIQIIGFDRRNSISDLQNQQGWRLTDVNFQVATSFQLLQLELCTEGLGLIFFPANMIDEDQNFARALKHKGPLMRLPAWLVCHQELRTNLKVRRVSNFIAEEYNQILLEPANT